MFLRLNFFLISFWISLYCIFFNLPVVYFILLSLSCFFFWTSLQSTFSQIFLSCIFSESPCSVFSWISLQCISWISLQCIFLDLPVVYFPGSPCSIFSWISLQCICVNQVELQLTCLNRTERCLVKFDKKLFLMFKHISIFLDLTCSF